MPVVVAFGTAFFLILDCLDVLWAHASDGLNLAFNKKHEMCTAVKVIASDFCPNV